MASQRGRKSAASLAVVKTIPGAAQRPDPPGELTKEEADEWRAIVGRLPVDWFLRECHPVLVQLCRHVIRARLLARAINTFPEAALTNPNGVDAYDRLTKMADRESRTIAQLATKLRLTPQSRYNPITSSRTASKVEQAEKPWQKTA